MTRSIFKFLDDDMVSVYLSGIDKNNKKWTAREIQKYDIPNYKHLLSDINIMKYMCQERQLRSEEIKLRNKQKIQEIFQFNEISINFDDKGYDLPTLDNLLNYCEKFEEFINILFNNEVIEANKLYTQENNKKFTFCKNAN
ncbi:14263_t:CDS:2, partial [Dentiscutata erythropus]